MIAVDTLPLPFGSTYEVATCNAAEGLTLERHGFVLVQGGQGRLVFRRTFIPPDSVMKQPYRLVKQDADGVLYYSYFDSFNSAMILYINLERNDLGAGGGVSPRVEERKPDGRWLTVF